MLTTTASYKTAVKADTRSALALTIVDFLNEWEYPFATAVASTTASGYSANASCNGRLRTTEYTGSGAYLPSALFPAETGWKGSIVSDDSGVLPTPETLTVTYSSNVTAQNFWIVGTEDAYPVDFTIEALIGATWTTIVSVTNNIEPVYSYRDPTSRTFTQVRATITKVYPHNNAAQLIEFGAITTVVLEGDDLAGISLLEETAAQSSTPFGKVTANECSVDIRNDARWFTPANVSSPFYGLIRPKLRFRSYIGIEVDTDNYEFMPLGTFRSETWNAPSQNITASFVGYDKLYTLGPKDVPMIRLQRNPTIKQLFEALFTSLGLSSAEYLVDSSLTQMIPYGWVPTGDVRSALTKLAEVGNCAVAMSRTNVLVVKPNVLSGAPVVTWTDDDMLTNAENLQLYSETYSKVTVKANVPVVGEDDEVLIIGQQPAPAGLSTIELAQLNGPVAVVTQVIIRNATTTTISGFSYGAHSITIQLSNTGVAEAVDVHVMGRGIELTQQSLVADSHSTLYDKELVVENELMQDANAASAYAATLLAYVSDPLATFQLNFRGDPSIELWDIIQIVDPTSKLGTNNMAITRQNIQFDESLSATADTRKV